jgi:hypothetical protein
LSQTETANGTGLQAYGGGISAAVTIVPRARQPQLLRLLEPVTSLAR